MGNVRIQTWKRFLCSSWECVAYTVFWVAMVADVGKPRADLRLRTFNGFRRGPKVDATSLKLPIIFILPGGVAVWSAIGSLVWRERTVDPCRCDTSTLLVHHFEIRDLFGIRQHQRPEWIAFYTWSSGRMFPSLSHQTLCAMISLSSAASSILHGPRWRLFCCWTIRFD